MNERSPRENRNDLGSIETQLRQAVGRVVQYRDGNWMMQGKIKCFDIHVWPSEEEVERLTQRGFTVTPESADRSLTIYAESIEQLHESGHLNTRNPETDEEQLKGVKMFGVNLEKESVSLGTDPESKAIRFNIGGFYGTILPEGKIAPSLSTKAVPVEAAIPKNRLKAAFRQVFKRK